jgi:hypothetical protein
MAGNYLHNSHRPTTASPTLVEHRFLVALRREHQIVEVVLRCVFLKGLNVSFKLFHFCARGGIFHPFLCSADTA